MLLKLELVLFINLVLFVFFIENRPVRNDLTPPPLKVIVNTTNFNQPNTETVVTSSVTSFKPLPLPQGRFRSNDVQFGSCDQTKNIVHNENIRIDSGGPSTLNGVFEFYIDSPITINCIEVLDKMPPGTGAEVRLKDGGLGYNWFHLNVQGKYARGINIVVTAYGVPDFRKIKFRKQ